MVVLLGLVGLVVLIAAVIAGVAGVLAWLGVLLARALRTSGWGRWLAQSRRETAAVGPPPGALVSQAPGPSPVARPEPPAARAVAVPVGAPAD